MVNKIKIDADLGDSKTQTTSRQNALHSQLTLAVHSHLKANSLSIRSENGDGWEGSLRAWHLYVPHLR